MAVHTGVVVILADVRIGPVYLAVGSVLDYIVVQLIGKSAESRLHAGDDSRTGSPHITFAYALEEKVDIEAFICTADAE